MLQPLFFILGLALLFRFIYWFYQYPLTAWRWHKSLNLKAHLRTLEIISADISGFQLSKQARQQSDAMDYVYGEIDPTAFIALLSLVKPGPTTVFYDLGSGIGKTVLLCAMVFHVQRSCGIELFSHLDAAAKTQRLRLQTYRNYSQKNIHFICGDYLQENFEDATLIFISATALFGDTWKKLNQRLENLTTCPLIITTSKPLTTKRYGCVYQTRVQMSWGVVNAYIHRNIGV